MALVSSHVPDERIWRPHTLSNGPGGVPAGCCTKSEFCTSWSRSLHDEASGMHLGLLVVEVLEMRFRSGTLHAAVLVLMLSTLI